MSGAHRWLVRLALVAAALVAVSWQYKGTFVDHGQVDPALLSQPRQTPTSRAAFEFLYKGRACRVRPVAEYEIQGLVATHNDIESFADIYHDSTSVDTKDVCLIWGSNLASDDFHQVEFSSGPFTCYFRWPTGVEFRLREASNTHLITRDTGVRAAIGQVRVGDQIRMRGLLVDYQMDDWEGFWRETSTVRNDSDCEVMLVEDLEILRRGTPGWYLTYRVAWAVLAAVPVAWLTLLWVDAGRRQR